MQATLSIRHLMLPNAVAITFITIQPTIFQGRQK